MSHCVEPAAFAGEPGSDPGDEMFLELRPGVRMVFCWCPRPAAPFRRGSPETEANRFDSEKPHWVTLSHGFWLAKHPVNQGQYHAVLGDRPSHFKLGDDGPVDTVSWDNAQRFCREAQTQMKIPGGWRLALPTEAQWEYACRAGAPFEFPFGVGDGRSLHAQWANFDGNHPYGEDFPWLYRKATVREGSFPPNAWGLHDMHGQLWEWCADWRGDYPDADERRPAVDPSGAETDVYRVLRGGSWFDVGRHCRAANRFGNAPANRPHYIGFRPALVPPGARPGPEAKAGAERLKR